MPIEDYTDEIRQAEREERAEKRKIRKKAQEPSPPIEEAGHQEEPPEPKIPDSAIVPESKPSTEEKVFGSPLPGVPTTLEHAMSIEGTSSSSNEVLGVLVDAHIKEVDSTLGRTYFRREDMAAVTDCLLYARHGAGGKLAKPMPWLSKWVLDKVRSLPSIDGKSREQFTRAWADSREERRREDERRNRERMQGQGFA